MANWRVPCYIHILLWLFCMCVEIVEPLDGDVEMVEPLEGDIELIDPLEGDVAYPEDEIELLGEVPFPDMEEITE